MQLFVVQMDRWGSPENHSYTLGVYSTIELASQAGDSERYRRAGKYEPSFTELTLDQPIIVEGTGT